MFEIEKNVPVPCFQTGSRHKYKYPFSIMEIGDSFFVPIEYTRESHRAVCSAAGVHGKRHKTKFTVRKVEGGIRVWRIE